MSREDISSSVELYKLNCVTVLKDNKVTVVRKPRNQKFQK